MNERHEPDPSQPVPEPADTVDQSPPRPDAEISGEINRFIAEKILLEAHRGLQEYAPRMSAPDRTRELAAARDSLVSLYEAWSRPDEAEKWRAPEDKSL